MALQITIVKSPQGVPMSEESKTFTELGGTIGRGAGNSWVLSDPDRFLSSRHCEISYEAGQYYLTDLSTNGTFVNDSPEPLGKGGRVALRDGDTFDLGDYRFALRVQREAARSPFASPASPFDIPDTASPLPVSSPFGDDIFGTGSDPLPLSPEPEETDPLAALDKLSAGAGNYGGNGYHPSPESDDPFQYSHYDGADALNQAVQWPESSRQNLIPDDWEDDLLGGGSASPAPPPPVADPLRPRPEHRSIPLTDPPAMPERPESKAASALDDWLGGSGSAPSARESEPPPPPVEPAPVPPNPQPAPARPNPAGPRPAAEAAKGGDAGALLVERMGLGERALTEQQIQEIAEVVGELLPVIVEGMMQVLRSRASIKNEFRMNVTTIQPVENNPLKFSVDTGEALENLFLRKSQAYKKPKEAFRDGFNGIAEHQVAIIAGIRAAFKSMMERFDPEHLEKQFDRHAKGAILPGMQKARYWTSYTEYYRNFVDNLEQSFQYLFGDEFVQAYEDQLRKLTAARKRNEKNEK